MHLLESIIWYYTWDVIVRPTKSIFEKFSGLENQIVSIKFFENIDFLKMRPIFVENFGRSDEVMV